MGLVLVAASSLAIALAANALLRARWGRALLSWTPWVAAAVLLALAAAALFAPPGPAQTSPGWGGLGAHPLFAAISVLAAAAIASLGLQRWRTVLAHWAPIDPDNPLHTAAMATAWLFIANHFSAYLYSGPAPQALAPVNVGGQLATFAILAGLAIAGVGFPLRRNLAQTTRRLGLRRPNSWQLLFAVGLGSAFQLVGLAAAWASHILTPGLAQSVDQASSTVFSGLLATPAGLALLVITAAVGEELLFRGALQPRLGIPAAALLFTAFHDQYGFSFELAGIFALALALGWLRLRVGLAACITAHAWFDLLAGVAASAPLTLAIAGAGIALCWVLASAHASSIFPREEGYSPIRWQQV